MRRALIASLALVLAVACQQPQPTQAKTPEAAPAGGSGDQNAPVAKWNGGSVTASELDAATFEQRKQALEQMIVKKLVEQKAKAEGIAPEALFKREVADKVKQPTDAEMKAFYDEQSKKQQLPPFE
ncbi:MAG: thioredoxin, partial [Anaeromyxobacteraceae bacterium]